jgi:hypothetical protein
VAVGSASISAISVANPDIRAVIPTGVIEPPSVNESSEPSDVAARCSGVGCIAAMSTTDEVMLIKVASIRLQVADSGPDGILISQINTRTDAEAAIRAMKYPPLGERGAA